MWTIHILVHHLYLPSLFIDSTISESVQFIEAYTNYFMQNYIIIVIRSNVWFHLMLHNISKHSFVIYVKIRVRCLLFLLDFSFWIWWKKIENVKSSWNFFFWVGVDMASFFVDGSVWYNWNLSLKIPLYDSGFSYCEYSNHSCFNLMWKYSFWMWEWDLKLHYFIQVVVLCSRSVVRPWTDSVNFKKQMIWDSMSSLANTSFLLVFFFSSMKNYLSPLAISFSTAARTIISSAFRCCVNCRARSVHINSFNRWKLPFCGIRRRFWPTGEPTGFLLLPPLAVELLPPNLNCMTRRRGGCACGDSILLWTLLQACKLLSPLLKYRDMSL